MEEVIQSMWTLLTEGHMSEEEAALSLVLLKESPAEAALVCAQDPRLLDIAARCISRRFTHRAIVSAPFEEADRQQAARWRGRLENAFGREGVTRDHLIMGAPAEDLLSMVEASWERLTARSLCTERVFFITPPYKQLRARLLFQKCAQRNRGTHDGLQLLPMPWMTRPQEWFMPSKDVDLALHRQRVAKVLSQEVLHLISMEQGGYAPVGTVPRTLAFAAGEFTPRNGSPLDDRRSISG